MMRVSSLLTLVETALIGLMSRYTIFPKFLNSIHAEEGNGQWLNVYEAEMGYLEPDWNLIELPDGREFRVRDGYRYSDRKARGGYV